jgi:GntR family transcriptional regulator, colanic acid and biofilm gene transcriptional regulator
LEDLSSPKWKEIALSTLLSEKTSQARQTNEVVRDPLLAQARRYASRQLCSGAWKPGERITIRALAQELGISTTPVREVLLQLVSSGCLELKQNTSFSVPPMSLDAYLETRRLRILLEGEAAAVAAERVSDAEIDRLAAIHGRVEIAERDQDIPGCLEFNRAFHLTLAELSHMATLSNFVEILWLRSGPILNALFPRVQPWQHGIYRHLDVIAGLRARDPAKAKAAIQNDIIEGGPLIEAVLRSQAAARQSSDV